MEPSPVWVRTCGSYIGRGGRCETCGWSKKSHVNFGRCPTCDNDMATTEKGKRSLNRLIKKGNKK